MRLNLSMLRGQHIIPSRSMTLAGRLRPWEPPIDCQC